MSNAHSTPSSPVMATRSVWSQVAVDILIEEYRFRRELYDVKDANYHNQIKKELAYQGIVEKLSSYRPDCTVDDVKKKINGLRSSYSQETEKMRSTKKSGAGTDDQYTPTVWWFKKLHFLKSFGEYNVNGTLYHNPAIHDPIFDHS